jgi:hypothetical protein
MRSREIEPTKWQEFVEAFSRRHDGWLVSIGLESESGKAELVARDVPLWGVIADACHNNEEVLVIVPEVEHVIRHPQSIVIDETDEGAETSLTITDDSGSRTVIEFRSPMRTEFVDGIAV